MSLVKCEWSGTVLKDQMWPVPEEVWCRECKRPAHTSYAFGQSVVGNHFNQATPTLAESPWIANLT